LGTKIQTVKFDVVIHELHDVDVEAILKFIANMEHVFDVEGNLVNASPIKLKER